MFTWTNNACVFALISALAGCQMETGSAARPGKSQPVSVLGGTITVAPPAGYCVDKASLRQQGDGAVALIGRCDGRSAVPPAVISLSLGLAGSGGAMAAGTEGLVAFFQSPPGRGMLSRTGDAKAVQILSASENDGALILQIAEAGQPDYWRAVLGLSGRLVTVSVQAPDGVELSAQAGRQILGATINALRKANPARQPAPDAQALQNASG